MKTINKESNGGTFFKILSLNEGEVLSFEYSEKGQKKKISLKCLKNDTIRATTINENQPSNNKLSPRKEFRGGIELREMAKK